MKKFTLAILLAVLTFQSHAKEPYLRSFEKVASYTVEELAALYKEKHISQKMIPVKNDVDVYEVIYTSHWHDNTPVKASGLYFVPKGVSGKIPLVVNHRGTTSVVEREIKLGGLQVVSIAFAADGYAVIMPDYIGLGKGEKIHLYHHARTEGLSTVDLIYATKEINKKIGMELSEQLFITGYSQGGHATMAAHKLIQDEFSNELKVTASAPLSGAYNLSGVQSETLSRPYPTPGYLPYLLYSYQEVYAMVDDINMVFKAPYDTLLPTLFDGKHGMGAINKALPQIPLDMVHEEIVEAYQNDPQFPFKKALEANDLHNWKPESNMMICYCKADEQVNYKNAIVAYKQMKANGAENVRIKHVAKKLNHGNCALFAYIYTKFYFDSFRDAKKKDGKMGHGFQRVLLDIGKAKVNKNAKKKKKRKEKQKKENE